MTPGTMRKHYTVLLRHMSPPPDREHNPITIFDHYTGKERYVSLRKAQEFVFGAVLRNDGIATNDDNPLMTIIEIFDRAELDKKHAEYEITFTKKVLS